jgi:signal transduction histidine kinase
MASSPSSPSALRPKRFALELPLEFRSHDSDHWSQAKTENISANGILFRTRKSLPPLTPVDLKLQLPAALTGEGVVRLLCSGYVVRSVEPRLPFKGVQVAATFLHAQLANGKHGPAAELRQAQFLAMRGEVGKLTHRLNTLLFIILGNAELMLLEPGDESKIRNFALQTRQAADEATTLVRSLAKTLK